MRPGGPLVTRRSPVVALAPSTKFGRLLTP